MTDVLNLQGDQPETPADEKASNVSWYKFCTNSYISVSICMVK